MYYTMDKVLHYILYQLPVATNTVGKTVHYIYICYTFILHAVHTTAIASCYTTPFYTYYIYTILQYPSVSCTILLDIVWSWSVTCCRTSKQHMIRHTPYVLLALVCSSFGTFIDSIQWSVNMGIFALILWRRHESKQSAQFFAMELYFCVSPA